MPCCARQREGVLRHHHGICRHTIDAHSVVCRELGIVFVVVVTAVEIFADASVGPQHIPFAVELHRDAVGVLMVAAAAIEGSHQIVVLLFHFKQHAENFYFLSP